MSLDGPRFKKAAEVARVTREGTQRLEAIAGVEAAATTWSLPLEPPNDPQFFTIEGRPLAGKPYHGFGDWRLVTPHYFDVFRIPVLRGRSFGDHDDASGAPVVIINQAMANALWPSGSPLGERIWLNKGLGEGFEEPAPRLVVGIAGDVKDGGLNATTGPIMYVPVAQVRDNVLPSYSQAFRLMWVVRTKTGPFSFSQEIQRRLREASGGLPVGHVRSMDQVRVESTARQDFTASLFTILAGLALLMAAIGIYGVMAYSVEQRRQEIGIRMALGASPRMVRRMILRAGARLTITGTVMVSRPPWPSQGCWPAFSLVYDRWTRSRLWLSSCCWVQLRSLPRMFLHGERCGWIRWWRYGLIEPISAIGHIEFLHQSQPRAHWSRRGGERRRG
jgi:putative ABC transport system permease protein